MRERDMSDWCVVEEPRELTVLVMNGRRGGVDATMANIRWWRFVEVGRV